MKSTIILLACAIIIGLSGCSDSPAEARAKNEQYLDQLANLVCSYQSKEHKLPESVEDALAKSEQTLPHRGDYYGRTYQFLKFQDTAFCFRAENVEVCYVNSKKVPHAEFVAWVRTHSNNDDWGLIRHIYDP